MILKIIQGEAVRDFGTCHQIAGENKKILQISNLTSGSITIYASNGDDFWEIAQFKDGSDMVFTANTQVRLDVGNYRIKAEGEANEDVKIRLS
jgi:hypothetical protein